MSKKLKRLEKLCAIPPPNDFTWDDLVSVMRAADFKEHCDGGSHYTFDHASGFTFSMSRSHPSGLLKKYQVRAAKEALLTVGEIGDKLDGSK